jgi:hypothetical protein
MGFIEQGGGAGATEKGDHQQTGGRLAWTGAGGGALIGALQHLAMTHRARRHGHQGSTGAEDFHGPAEAETGLIDGGIGAAGITKE